MKSIYYAVILAGGIGNRFNDIDGNNLPKQFVEFGGKTVLEHSISAFEQNPKIKHILIVMNEGYLEKTGRIIANAGFNKVLGVISGGDTRFLSSYAGLQAINRHINGQDIHDTEKTGNTANLQTNINTIEFQSDIRVLIHDAARAYINQEVIDNVTDGLDGNDGVQPIVPVTDTLVYRSQGRWITQNRDEYATVQTPQGFSFPAIYNAYRRAIASPETSWTPTDDISVLQEYARNPVIISVSGDYHNKKITYPEDLR